MSKKETFGVILDTSFMIRLLSTSDNLHNNAVDYFKYFLDKDIPMFISTIAIAEYCVNGEISDLPLHKVRVLPFNIMHANTAGKFAKVIYDARAAHQIEIPNRLLVPNDAKIIAQADCSKEIQYFVTSDVKSSHFIKKLSEKYSISVEHMDINIPISERFGILDME